MTLKQEKLNLIKSYNTILKRIINFYHEKCPNKDSSYAHIRRARVFMDTDPKSAMEYTGCKLYKYKEIILSKRPDKIHHYAENEQKETLNEYTSQKDIANKLIENVLLVWRDMTPVDKDDLAEQLIEMFKIYVNYLLLEKE